MTKIDSKTPQTMPAVRQAVKDLLTHSAAFSQLPPNKQSQIAQDTALVVNYLVSTVRQTSGPALQTSGAARKAFGAARNSTQQVDFPAFVSSLIKSVFQAIVSASIEQMKAYGHLVAAIAKSLDKFLDENVSENEARDYLVNRFPDLCPATTPKAKPPAIRRLATQRQQLLATMVLMGINRLVVTSGNIRAKIRP